MSKSKYTRRDFLNCTGLGMALIAGSSCRSIPGRASGRQPFTFVQLCDTQVGMGGYEHDVQAFNQAVAQINTLKPDFVVICGDLVHDADDKSFATVKDIKAGFDAPCYCAPGNHDVGNTPTSESLQRYRGVVGDDYYSVEHKGYVFVFVNTQLWKTPVKDESLKHDAWLEHTLASAAKRRLPVFIVGHYPLFLEEPGEAEEYMNLPLDGRTALLDLFERSGVVAVLGGHTHRLVINDYKGMQLVNGETTSKNFDNRPLGFRVWHVAGSASCRHEFVALDGF